MLTPVLTLFLQFQDSTIVISDTINDQRGLKKSSFTKTNLIRAMEYQIIHVCSLHVRLSCPRVNRNSRLHELLFKTQKCEVIRYVIGAGHEKHNNQLLVLKKLG